jgi:hypothetical protein
VDQAVMRVAQEDQVVQIGTATVSPMDDVVGFHPLLSLASREPAPTVSVSQEPGDLAGDRPSPPPDPECAVP